MNEYRYGKQELDLEHSKTNFDIEEFLKDLRRHSKERDQVSRASKMDVTIPSANQAKRGVSKGKK